MRLTSKFVVLAALCPAALGAPAKAISILDSAEVWESNADGRLPLSRMDMAELARRATVVNGASCPPTSAPVTLPLRGLPEDSIVIASSDDEEREVLRDEVDLGWYITHSPSTQTVTLAISSLPTVDDLLEVLASEPIDGEEFVQLPLNLFPDSPDEALISHSFLPALDTHGATILVSLLEILETPPPAPKSLFPDWAWKVIGRAPPSGGIKRVEIVGHGMGSALGLLVSLSLQNAAAIGDTEIISTLFSLPRMGDENFADYVDSRSSPKYKMRRVTSYADTVPHLPAAHRGFFQPKKGEIWVPADPRTAYACMGTDGLETCSEGIPLQRTKLEDFDGPFGGVWIKGVESCGTRFDVSSL